MNNRKLTWPGREPLVLLCALLCLWVVFALFTGIGPLSSNPYNSYSLQAQAWLDGRLDLGQNFAHLELAIFEGRYYVSFPPFPSLLLLPLVALFGTATPDHLLCALAFLAGGLLAYHAALRLNWAPRQALFAALFLTAGSNLLFVGFCGWVWFLAQTLSFAFTMGALYCALGTGQRSTLLSLLWLCCAAGCRPFQLVYLPLVLYLLWRGSGLAPVAWAGRHWWCALPAVALGCVYMGLNFARFGSVFEFGHNYLPEFTAAADGQFSLAYLGENLHRLLRLPALVDGRLALPQFDGFNLFLASPLFLAAPLAILGRREQHGGPLADQAGLADRASLAALAGGLVVLHLLLLCAHKTMGGWQFGNRYTIDALPAVFLAYLSLRKKPAVWDGLLCLFGLALNLVGTVLTYA